PRHADRDRAVGHRVGQRADARQNLRTEYPEVDELLALPDASAHDGTTALAGVEQRAEALRVVGPAPEDGVYLVEEQRPRVALDAPVEHRFTHARRPPRPRDEELHHLEEAWLAAAP